jgi:hypothetical protein
LRKSLPAWDACLGLVCLFAIGVLLASRA